VSPDRTLVASAIDRTVSRGRLAIAIEAAAAGSAVAAWSRPAGVAVAIGVAVWRARDATRTAAVRALERANRHARNVLVTFDEIERGALSVTPAVRDRVQEDAAGVVRSLAAGTPFRWRPGAWLTLIAVASWTAAFAIRPGMRRNGVAGIPSAAPAAVAAIAPSPLHVTVLVEPPPYTRVAAATLVDPPLVQAIENSRVTFSIEPRGAITVEVDGAARGLPAADARFTEVVKKSGYVAMRSEAGATRTIPITVTPDALPSVRVTAPARDLVYSGGNPRIAFDVRATDDYGLRSLSLKFTKVSGSGEQFTFTDGEIPLSIARSDARDWRGSASRQLADLNLQEGDVLVYRAVASDARPGGGEAGSDAYFIEISKVGVAAGDAFTLPEQESRYALSQQMLIVKTERLMQRAAAMSKMSDMEMLEASRGLAVEQRMIRSEFVFMLGGEIEDEEVEAAQSTELQEGRLANRGQRDLRAATIAMSQAEKFLTAASLADALRMERAAVAALQRAFARDRYILRALATRSQLDASRRLTGAVTQPIGWTRVLPDVPENRRAAQLQGLLEGLGDAAAQGRAGADARPALAVMAALAVRIDPESEALRQAAADLQRLADTWPTLDRDARPRALDPIVAVAAGEARRALADPPAAVGGPR
jgi:hypothetical protein